MSPLSIQVPFPVFQDRDGQPLENGYVWIGEPNLNPQTNPVVAYYDSALTIVAPQPLRTLNGYISRAGTPAQIYVDGTDFSILVQDSKGSMVYNFPDGTGISPDACGVTYNPPFTGAVAYPVCEKLAQYVSVKDFGAVGDGTTDDTAAIQAAIDAVANEGGGTVYINPGNYSVSQLVWKDTVSIFGAGNTSKLIANGDPPDQGIFVSTAGPITNCFLRDFYIDCSAQVASGNGLYLSRLTRCEISGLYIYNARAFGSLIFKSINCKYLKNTIDTTRQWDGMTISGSGVNQSVNNLIEGNIVLNSYDSGIGFTASQGTVCVGNLVDRRAITPGGSYYAPGIDASGCQNSVITGNYVIGNQFGISLLQHPNSGYNPFRVTCTGNTVCNSIYGIMIGSVVVIPPAVTTYSLNEIILSGNKIVEASVEGIHIDTASYITVSGNDISYCGNGILVTGSARIILNGNSINRSTAYGINISSGVTYLTFINNVSVANTIGDYTGAPGIGSTASGNIDTNGQETFYSSVYGNNLLGVYTVATLPTGSVGVRAFVTDANTPVFGNAVVGGGSTRIPVFHNSLNWVVG